MNESARSLIDLIDVADDQNMIANVLQTFSKSWGYEHFSYLQTEGSEVKTVNSYPPEWQDRYLENEYAKIDPVVEEAKRRREMFSWSADDWLDRRGPELRRFRDEAIGHGIRTGVTMAIEGSYCSTIMLTFSSGKKREEIPQLFDPIDGLRVILAVHYRLEHVGARQAIAPKQTLSAREKMCVKWAIKGKSSSDMAVLTGLNIRTIQHYLDNARQKLDARTLAQLVGLLKDRGWC
ncbi:LuxR family transcriptional activator of conjugal transfer of Ti plasmids [Neorhizobium huautlense]|uniref:LuxR family transcriptional activator of conjugal transfer of Ti plasmids n=1 Tax=Neorhizobium huautlense TaxID=67774 RepID=A0ABT9PVX3_9HYPH|nr:autoinducer binding domain-containing protein [Neorhizobium huautlense]MDP9838590.1 LuxR family transcriptional activator of conjugal transfer of Ti plasmids [Neorhizobium huautlense]